MNNKPWYTSYTLWAAKIAIVLQVLPDVVSWADSHLGFHLATNPIVIKVLTIFAAAIVIYRKFFGDNAKVVTPPVA